MFEGLDPILLPPSFIFFTLSTIGLAGNAIMIIATVKARRTKSPCHIMIALTCAADFLHEVGQYPFVYHFHRNSTMIQSNCFWLQLIPMIGACAGSPLILCLGLDRFIAVCFPSRYRLLQMMPYRYVLCSTLLPTLYASYVTIQAFLYKDQSLVQCGIPQSFGVIAFDSFNQIGMAVNVAIFVVYGITFFILRRSGARSLTLTPARLAGMNAQTFISGICAASGSKVKNVFKSIAVIVMIVLCGWLLTFFINSLAEFVTLDVYTTNVINMYAGIPVNIVLMSNVFVYYGINAEYREVINQSIRNFVT